MGISSPVMVEWPPEHIHLKFMRRMLTDLTAKNLKSESQKEI